MRASRRVLLAREALPSVTAWAELVIGPERASQVATDAVVSAASAARGPTVSALVRTARDAIAHGLAQTDARFRPDLVPTDPVPTEGPTPASPDAERTDGPAPSGADIPLADNASVAPYLPGFTKTGIGAGATVRPADEPDRQEPPPDRRSPKERLADALVTLPPHQRLAAVRFYLDGDSVADIASLFAIAHADAVALLEAVTSVLAPLVGEHDLPDFTADVTEIDVVSR